MSGREGDISIALLIAVNALIDARLAEYGLITAEAEPEPEKPAKPKARGKGKPAAAPEHTQDELKDLLIKLNKAQDKQAVVDALSRFGCKKLSDIRDDQIDEFHTYLETKLESGDDPAAADLFG